MKSDRENYDAKAKNADKQADNAMNSLECERWRKIAATYRELATPKPLD